MKRKWFVLMGLLLLAFSGCQRRIIEEGSSLLESSSLAESSSKAESISSEPEPPDDPFQDIFFSSLPDVSGSVTVSYPDSLDFSHHFFWTDPSHIYLFSGQLADGVIVNIENSSLKHAPGYISYGWNNIDYQDDYILLSPDECTIIKLDRDLNQIDSYQLKEPEPHDDIYYVSFIHLPSETIYYIQQNDSEKPLLWRQKGEQAEIAAELPPLREGESYSTFKVSPSGDKCFICRDYNSLRTNCIFFLDLKSGSVTSAATRPGWENYPAGFFLPDGKWMGEQPVFLVEHEYRDRVQSLAGLNSTELLYGSPLESKAEVFYNPAKDSNWANVGMSDIFGCESPWNCIMYETFDRSNKIKQTEFFYFRDNGTCLSYIVPPVTDKQSIHYPQVSPDFSYLAYVFYDNEAGSKLCVIPTENLWEPLDWQKLQMELEKMNHEFLN